MSGQQSQGCCPDRLLHALAKDSPTRPAVAVSDWSAHAADSWLCLVGLRSTAGAEATTQRIAAPTDCYLLDGHVEQYEQHEDDPVHEHESHELLPLDTPVSGIARDSSTVENSTSSNS